MLRRPLQLLLAFVLILGLIPGLGEVIEQGVELARHGHFAHTVSGEPAQDHTENGCSPVQHTCICHAHTPTAALGVNVEQPRFLDGLVWTLVEAPGFQPAQDRRRPGEPLAPTNRATAPPTPPPNATV